MLDPSHAHAGSPERNDARKRTEPRRERRTAIGARPGPLRSADLPRQRVNLVLSPRDLVALQGLDPCATRPEIVPDRAVNLERFARPIGDANGLKHRAHAVGLVDNLSDRSTLAILGRRHAVGRKWHRGVLFNF